MIEQTCSGLNVAGAPQRGASSNRSAIGACAGPANQRARQWRTVLGQTQSWRAISRTPVPAAERKIISARSANWRGVLCARERRSSSDCSSGEREIGVAERRDTKPPGDSRQGAAPFAIRQAPKTRQNRARRPILIRFSPTRGKTDSPRMSAHTKKESALPATCTR